MSNLDDIRDWKTLGLPIAASWNAEGFDPTFQVGLVKAGHRWLVSQFVPNYDAYDATGGTSCLRQRQVEKWVDPHADALRWISDNRLPLCLRTNNICDAFTRSHRYRGRDFCKQPLVYRQLPDGGLDQMRICDPLGPVACWEIEGEFWAASPWVRRIGEHCPSPAWLMFLENNEGSYDDVRRYVDGTGSWKPDLEALSVRMAEWLSQPRPQPSPAWIQEYFWEWRRTQYAGLCVEFIDESPWPTCDLLTAAFKAGPHPLICPQVPSNVEDYGYAPDGMAYDAASPAQYITGQNGDLTSVHYWSQISNMIPAWEWSEKHNANSWREVSVSINAAGAVAGDSAGHHGVVVPDMFEAFCGFLL